MSGSPPAPPASPFPATRSCTPSGAPAGISTCKVDIVSTRPVPSHVVHGVSAHCLRPPHFGQVVMLMNWENPRDWLRLPWPWPLHVGHVTRRPPFAPVPRHTSQGAARGTWSSLRVPPRRSSRETAIVTWRSRPRRGPLCRWRPPKKFSKRLPPNGERPKTESMKSWSKRSRTSPAWDVRDLFDQDRKSTRLNSSHLVISYAVFCLKKKKNNHVVSLSY